MMTAEPGNVLYALTDLRAGIEPACAKVCPTNSIQFGDIEELKKLQSYETFDQLHKKGITEAYIYGMTRN